MSSMLLGASRVAARSACSAVSAASRRAAGAGAATTALLRSTPVPSPLSGRYLASRPAAVACLGGAVVALLRRRSHPVASPSPPLRRCLSSSSSHMADSDDEGHVDFPFTDKDLESDEALWALYERWCKAFREERSCEEMQRRFDEFKSFVLFVDSFNKKAIRNGKSIRLEVNMYADGKLAEEQSCSLAPSDFFDTVPYSESPIIARAGPLLNKEVSEEGFSKRGSELEDFTYPY